MVNYIWVGLLVIGIVFAMFNGTMEEVNAAILKGASDSVTIVISLVSVLVFWLGLMKIVEVSGLLNRLIKLFKPAIVKLFPEIPGDHPAMGYILSNMIANLFGLGNAATPLGLKAMEQMSILHEGKDYASRSMITFLALNTSSITLIPTTVIAIRMKYGAVSPTDIVVPTIIATIISGIFALLIDRYFYYRRTKKGR